MKKLFVLVAALLLISSYAYADYYNYGNWNLGYTSAYGIDGWVGSDGTDRIIFYSSNTAYIYTVTTDANPNLHPSNPDATGSIATRTFTLEDSFALQNSNYSHECEFYVGSDGFYLGAKNGIEKYDFAGTYQTTLGPPSPFDGAYYTQSLAYDVVNNDWYAGSIGPFGQGETRTIYKLDGDNLVGGWNTAFTYTSEPSSGHHDGLEMLAGGNLLIADYSGQIVEYTTTGTKVEVHNHDPFGTELEGMGYGALGHFWGGSHNGQIFEFGSGSLPSEPVPEPATILLVGTGLAGLAIFRRKKKVT